MQKNDENDAQPGVVVLFGSGETSPSGRKAFDRIFRSLTSRPRVALLETPAGFELNSARVIGRVGEFLVEKLQNYKPRVDIISARARGTWHSPDNPEIVTPMLEADLIFMGPGSPTYAVRQLENSLAWQMVMARHRLGAVLALASAATIAISDYALPVYEIYKVGEDPHWKRGLNLFGQYGLPLVFVPHWNNQDGGQELDTSRCFIGQKRFLDLFAMLPPDQTVIGIDEKTALIMNIVTGHGEVIGLGGVTIIMSGPGSSPGDLHSGEARNELEDFVLRRGGRLQYYRSGDRFLLKDCCPFEIPDLLNGLSSQVWQNALAAQARLSAENTIKKPEDTPIPFEVRRLADLRLEARLRKNWSAADAYREKITSLGWVISDLPDGKQTLSKKED